MLIWCSDAVQGGLASKTSLVRPQASYNDSRWHLSKQPGKATFTFVHDQWSRRSTTYGKQTQQSTPVSWGGFVK